MNEWVARALVFIPVAALGFFATLAFLERRRVNRWKRRGEYPW